MWAAKKKEGREGRGGGCLVGSDVNHICFFLHTSSRIQHQRLQYQTMPTGMCTASILMTAAPAIFFFLLFLFFAQVINVSVKQHTPEKAIVGLAKAQCMIGIVHFQRYCVGALILL